MIRFQCPNCGVKLTAKDDKAGKMAPCPKCQTPIKVEVSVPSPPPPPQIVQEPVKSHTKPMQPWLLPAILVSVFMCFPISAVLVWLTPWDKKIKIGWTAMLGAPFVFIFVMSAFQAAMYPLPEGFHESRAGGSYDQEQFAEMDEEFYPPRHLRLGSSVHDVHICGSVLPYYEITDFRMIVTGPQKLPQMRSFEDYVIEFTVTAKVDNPPHLNFYSQHLGSDGEYKSSGLFDHPEKGGRMMGSIVGVGGIMPTTSGIVNNISLITTSLKFDLVQGESGKAYVLVGMGRVGENRIDGATFLSCCESKDLGFKSVSY